MLINTNTKTGIHYGYIAAHCLDEQLVDTLLYGRQAKQESDGDEDEPDVSGTYEEVSYATSYLGGVLNFWIFESPHITQAATSCGICVPGAGNLDNLTGSVTCYDVPADWRCEV